jgi:potassium channel subfamily K
MQLYFCDGKRQRTGTFVPLTATVTILTVGFGDLVLTNDLGRGLVFPYTVGGIIMLGLVISSIAKFAAEMGEENVVWKHADRVRHRTLERTTTDPLELERAEILRKFRPGSRASGNSRSVLPSISAPFDARVFGRAATKRKAGDAAAAAEVDGLAQSSQSVRSRRSSMIPAVHRRINIVARVKHRQARITLLRGERDRFNEMRRIQHSTASFKRWWALTLSVMAFFLLWGVGAVIFWQAERDTQGMTYFQSLYFCYVSLLTIGYGDFAPKSNAGRPFFVVWSLIAVPTMTLLISDMSGTIIEAFKRGSFLVADFTVLLKRDAVSAFMEDHPRLRRWFEERRAEQAREERLERGMQIVDASALEAAAEAEGRAGPGGDDDDDDPPARRRAPDDDDDDDEDDPDNDPTATDEAALRPSLDQIAREVDADARHPPDEAKLARRLAIAIRKVAADLHMAGATADEKRYSFEEWAELTRLMRFTSEGAAEACRQEGCDVIDWDWLGENSPLMSHVSEPEFVLDRLCESLVRYTRRVERRVRKARKESYAKGRRRSSAAAREREREKFLAARAAEKEGFLGIPLRQ